MKGHRKDHFVTIILTGLSGAGKTIALNAFEDSDYFCVDNLPASLIKTFVHLCRKTSDISRIAIGIDIRERKFSAVLPETITSLKRDLNVEILFLEADEDALARRFKETRRPHPLAYKDLKKAIRRERSILSSIREMADRVIDTTLLSPHQLRKIIMQNYSVKKEKPMSITLISFGYKYGAPIEADLLFDVRFLPNPNFIRELKQYDGTTPEVKSFLFRKKETKHFFSRLLSFLEYLIPRYREEGRNYLTVGIGCTGGKHRSPALVQEIEKSLKKKKLDVSVLHRDMRD